MSLFVMIINKKTAEYQVKVNTAITAMENIDLESTIQEKIKDYFRFTQATLK